MNEVCETDTRMIKTQPKPTLTDFAQIKIEFLNYSFFLLVAKLYFPVFYATGMLRILEIEKKMF